MKKQRRGENVAGRIKSKRKGRREEEREGGGGWEGEKGVKRCKIAKQGKMEGGVSREGKSFLEADVQWICWHPSHCSFLCFNGSYGLILQLRWPCSGPAFREHTSGIIFPHIQDTLVKWLQEIKLRNLENMMLSERSQTQKATCCMIPFVWNTQPRKIHGEGRLVTARGWDTGDREWWLNWQETSFGVMTMFWN